MGRSARRHWTVRMVGMLAAVAASGVLSAQPAGPAAGAPMVNLRVELRQAEAGQQSSAGAGVAVSGRGAVFGGGVQASAGEHGVQQQLLVLNGGRAGIRLGQARPLQWLQAVPSGAPGGVAWVPGTVWMDTGTGFTVRPHWPGGSAPVTVEIAAESGGLQALSSPGAGSRSSQLLTTLQLPLGEWVTVAESLDEQQRRGGRHDSGSRSLVVQMRVTRP